MATTVTISGYEPEGVIDINDSHEVGDLGEAVIEVAKTPSNRNNISSGDRVVIDRSNSTWTGFVTGDPTTEDDGVLQIRALDGRYELKNSTVSRPFFDIDSGQAIRDAIEYKAESRGREAIHLGSDMTGWESDCHVFELGNMASKQLHERGSNIVFGGIREGASGVFRMTYTDVPSRAVPGPNQYYKLVTRMRVNDPADQIRGEIELRDHDGNSAVWEVDHSGNDFTEYDLSLEDADPRGQLTQNGTLEYRLIISGDIADNIGVAIDHASTFPFNKKERDTDLLVDGVLDTDRVITRRFDESVLAMIDDLSVEDGFRSWIDEDETVHYEPAGGEEGTLQIVRGETPVVSAEFDRDYERITNEVIVQGDNVQETVRDPESVRYYGTSSKDEPIVDDEIKTSSEAQDRGDGYLLDNAWNDTIATFEVADTRYQQVQKGNAVFVSWPNEDLQGFFVAESIETDRAGLVTIELGVRV